MRLVIGSYRLNGEMAVDVDSLEELESILYDLYGSAHIWCPEAEERRRKDDEGLILLGAVPCRAGFRNCPYLSHCKGEMWCCHPYTPEGLNQAEEDAPEEYAEMMKGIRHIEEMDECPAEEEVTGIIRALGEEE